VSGTVNRTFASVQNSPFQAFSWLLLLFALYFAKLRLLHLSLDFSHDVTIGQRVSST